MSASAPTSSCRNPAFITTELQSLVFTPTEHQVPAGQTVTTNFDISVSNGPSTSDNSTTSVVTTGTHGQIYVLTTTADIVNGGAGNDEISQRAGPSIRLTKLTAGAASIPWR